MTHPAFRGSTPIVRRLPVGPIATITPFNFPLNLVAHKWAPAIAAGCPIVHKPAPQKPISALRLAALIQQAAWPAGGLNVLPATVEDAEPRVTDDRLKMLSFTGSPAVGWELKKRAGKKRVTLELGGNAGVIANDVPSFRIDHMPYGGTKESGLGREGIRYALKEMTERKILVAGFPG